MATSEKGQAIPFIAYTKGKGFVLTKEAEEFLKTIAGEQIGVISITGKYRTGKSFFINRVLLNTIKDGFNVGPTVNPCTKGLWIWNKVLKSENPDYPDMKVLLVDTEGFAGIDENTNHDTRIFLFSLLLSSFFIYNSTGSIDESALNNLSLIINLAKEIQIKSGEAPTSEDSEEFAQYFPAFLWIVRDFALKLVDPNGHPITSKEYLENALKPQKGVSDAVESKNRIRRMLKHFFTERDCCTMVRPLENESVLQKLDEIPNDRLRPEFLDQMNGVRKRIFKKVKPKSLNGQNLNAGMFLEVCKAYLEAINTGGVPNIENAWTYVCKQESQKAVEDCVNMVDQRLGSESLQRSAVEESELKEVEQKLREDMLEHFKKKSVGDFEETKVLFQEVEKQFEERFAKFKVKNAEKWVERFSTWVSNHSNLEEKLKDQQYSNFFEFKAEIEQIKLQYEKDAPKGVSKNEFWAEYSLKMYALAAESISKRTEEQYSMQNARLTQRLEMTETELNTKRKEYETERNSLYNKIQEVERERAFFKANENSVNEKIETLKRDKEKFERMYNELLEGSKQREDKMSQESRDRIAELERRIEAMRTETSQRITELEKQNALLEQESHFIKRENDSYRMKIESYENLKSDSVSALKQKDDTIEEYKKKLAEFDFLKAQEISQLRQDLEKQASNLNFEEERRKENSKQQTEWTIEKSYLENQVGFLKSQLEENKRLHDALLLALEQGMHGNENEGTSELVETNKNLSAALDKMEARCKVLEDKCEKLKKYKRMVKNSSTLQCAYCSKFISANIFLQHTTTCNTPQPAAYNKPNIITPISSANQWSGQNELDPNMLQISINQTMVKENADAKPYTEYLIQVAYSGIKWSVSRKYKAFCELHQNLNTQFPSLKFPESAFTILGAFNNLSYVSNTKRPTVIEERRKALQQYLRDLAKLDIVRNSNPFKKFLELERVFDQDQQQDLTTTGSLQPGSTVPSQRGDKRDQGSDKSSGKNDDSGNYGSIQAPQKSVGEHVRHYSPIIPQNAGENYQTQGQGQNVKIDKSLFSQSPMSFMKNWQEKALNKENKNPRSMADNGNALLQKIQQAEESEIEKVDNNSDFSSMSLRFNQEPQSHDFSQERINNQGYKGIETLSNQRSNPQLSSYLNKGLITGSTYTQSGSLNQSLNKNLQQGQGQGQGGFSRSNYPGKLMGSQTDTSKYVTGKSTQQVVPIPFK